MPRSSTTATIDQGALGAKRLNPTIIKGVAAANAVIGELIWSSS
jgi:hypothetical protein